MSLVKRIAYNTIIQIVGRVIGLLIMLVIVNYISNHFIVDGSSVTGYGQYTIVFTFVSIIGVAADLGLFTLLVREIATKTKAEVEDLIGNALGFRFALFILTLVLFLIINRFLPYPNIVKWGILIGIGSAFINLFSQIVAALLQAKMVTDRIVIAETLGKILIAVLTVVFLKNGMGLAWVVIANLLGNLAIFAISILFAKKFVSIGFRFNFLIWRKMLRELGTIAIITLLSLIHFKIDSLILSFYHSAADVGIYGLSYKLLEIIAIIPAIYAANVMPHLSNMYQTGEREKMAVFVRKSVTIIIAVAVPIAIVVYLMAPWLITFISSDAFIQSVTPLRILIFAIIFAFVADVITGSVIAARAQKQIIWAYCLAVFANIVLNLLIIPKYSYIGAAYTTVITEGLLTICLLGIARANLGKNIDLNSIFKICISGLVVIALISILKLDFGTQLTGFSNNSKVIQMFRIIEYSLPILASYGIFMWVLFGTKLKNWSNRSSV